MHPIQTRATGGDQPGAERCTMFDTAGRYSDARVDWISYPIRS